MSARPPLAGVRVLDFGHILAGPYCARLLADLGANVVKVESRSRAEGMGRSHLGQDYTGRRDRSPHMLMTNRNKRSVTLNLKTPGGVAVAAHLAAKADVLVENYSAGAMDRLGLGYDDLAPKNPGLIYLSLSGYGHHGPRRDWTSMNLNLQAYSGLMMTTGEESDPPTTIAASWNDYLGALHGCAAVLNALLARSKTGHGAKLDLSQFECSVASVGALLMASAALHRAPTRLGNRSEHAAPQGVYRCFGKDEWCAISIQTDEQWQALAGILGVHNTHYDTPAGRVERQQELDRILEGWTSERPPAKVEAVLQAAGVPAQRMRRTRDLLAGPSAAMLFAPVEDPPGHSQLMSRLPFHFATSCAAEPSRAPLIGEHTREVLGEWLSLGPAELEQLETEGALE